jgi:hypothetical protein
MVLNCKYLNSDYVTHLIEYLMGLKKIHSSFTPLRILIPIIGSTLWIAIAIIAVAPQVNNDKHQVQPLSAVEIAPIKSAPDSNGVAFSPRRQSTKFACSSHSGIAIANTQLAAFCWLPCWNWGEKFAWKWWGNFRNFNANLIEVDEPRCYVS